MSLTHQFIITSALPIAFIVLLIYDRYKGGSRPYGLYWSITLFMAALWSTHLLSYYWGVTLPAEIALTWRIAARHMLGIVGIFVLLTTMAQVRAGAASRTLLTGIATIFWVAALLLDPGIWPYHLPDWADPGQPLAHFNLWAGVWVTSWIIPMTAAMMLTRQAVHDALSAIYRNRLNYWATVLVLFALSGALALIQDPNQPAWQELGGLGMLLAATLGTATLVRSSLPNLRLALRHTLARLASSLLILISIWLFLFFVVNRALTQGREWTILEVWLAAAVFTALFSAINRYIPRLLRRLLMPGYARSGSLADQPSLITALPDPEALGEILLRLTQYNIAADNARLLFVDEQEAEKIVLRPLAQVGHVGSKAPIEIDGAGAIAGHLRRRLSTPLSMYDIDSTPSFGGIPTEERQLVQQSGIEIFMPLGVGDKLVGVLALGEKYTGEPYDHADLQWLQDIGAHGGLLLWQARELQQRSAHMETMQLEIRELQRDTRKLHELLDLHERFTQLISPALRRPFSGIQHTLEELQGYYDGNGAHGALSELNDLIAQLRLTLNHLIVSSASLRRQHDFAFSTVDMAEVIYSAVHELDAMASARHVAVNVRSDSYPSPVQGDFHRLSEAVQHLLHNAIRFNRIGGQVDLHYGASDNQFFLHMRDNGVGMAPEHLSYVWQASFPPAPKKSAIMRRGFGLFLARFIASAHGGYLEASSEDGIGSTFSLYLPLATIEPPAAQDTVTAA